MKIAMHSNDLCARGVPKSVFNYSENLEQRLGHQVICLYDRASPFNDDLGIRKFSQRFATFGYDHWAQANDFLKSEAADVLYMQKMGANDGKIAASIPTVVHAVFQAYQPHGNVYAYISEWLANQMPGKHEHVPYIVRLPQPKSDLRAELGIPSEATVFGRHGAFSQFDIEFAQRCVKELAQLRKDIYFLFLNTQRFCEEIENIIHLPATVDEEFIACFIESCDAMLHARARGESFGLAVAEFLFLDKPVITFAGGNDKNHIHMLGDKGLFYKDYESLRQQLVGFNRLPEGHYSRCVEPFKEAEVMQKFVDVFLREFS